MFITCHIWLSPEEIQNCESCCHSEVCFLGEDPHPVAICFLSSEKNKGTEGCVDWLSSDALSLCESMRSEIANSPALQEED